MDSYTLCGLEQRIHGQDGNLKGKELKLTVKSCAFWPMESDKQCSWGSTDWNGNHGDRTGLC